MAVRRSADGKARVTQYCAFDPRSSGLRKRKLPHGALVQTIVANAGYSYEVCDLDAGPCFDCGETPQRVTWVGREALCGPCLFDRFYLDGSPL